jgi:hypothetical protein
MQHRKTPSPKAFVPSSWFIVLTVMLCVGAAGWLGWLVVGGGDDAKPNAGTSATATKPSASPSATDSPTSESPKTEPTPSAPTATTEGPVDRTAPVSVLNNTTIRGLATTFSNRVRQAGWTVAAVGNWRGSVPGNTVYYPPGRQDEAELLGQDVGIDRVLPSVSPMRMDRLTIILSGPQQ